MQIITLLLCTLSFLACAQERKEVSILFQPEGRIIYTYSLSSDQLNLKGTLQVDFAILNDLVEAIIEIAEMSGNAGDNRDTGHSAFIGKQYTRKYDHYGKSVDLDNLPAQIVNMDLFTVEFPKTPISEGSRWKATKTAKPDMIFDIIEVEYTCVELKEGGALIDAVMIFSTKDKFAANMRMTKEYRGQYLVTSKEGLVINAKLDMQMFSGVSELYGTIVIEAF